MHSDFPPEARAGVQGLASSQIREVANSAMGRADVLPFWFGESDRPTAGFIRQAAQDSIAAGETFYAQNLGGPICARRLRNICRRCMGARCRTGASAF